MNAEEDHNISDISNRTDDYDANDNLNDDKLYRLERAEEKGPNAFISEAEALLNSSSLALDGSRYDFNKSTGYTPSVIGAQEVYRDPRQKRLQKAEDEKAEKTKRDGAKLSFQEKMKLFAVEAGEKTPNRDKAKISRAQRELEDEESGNEERSSDTENVDEHKFFSVQN
jgi:afadin